MDPVVLSNVVARAVLDTRLKDFEQVRVELELANTVAVLCDRTCDVATLEVIVAGLRKEKVFHNVLVTVRCEPSTKPGAGRRYDS